MLENEGQTRVDDWSVAGMMGAAALLLVSRGGSAGLRGGLGVVAFGSWVGLGGMKVAEVVGGGGGKKKEVREGN